MIDNHKITKGIILTIPILILVAILHSCKGQYRIPEYNPKAIDYNNKAVQLMQLMEYDSALILLNKAIGIDKNYYVPYSNMTEIYLSRKQFDKALQACDKVVEIKPDLAEGWTFAGILYDRKGDSSTAKKYYKKSIDIFDNRINNPDKKKDLFANRLNHAFAMILLGQDKAGKDEMRILKSENPDNMMFDTILNFNKEDYIRQVIDNE